ncbi:hypothetical protein HY413_01180 [Candidatus Kaiserbacteria bacterium]|nr:hypothetical protein [Candidatus Kaiserbacteria bacterium]
MSIKIVIAKWSPLAVVIIGFGGLLYTGTHQVYRQDLNDPQIQIARDVANALRDGAEPASVVPRYVFNADESLSPFVAIFDENGTPLESSAAIAGAPPAPPQGIFDSARTSGENRVTWQPSGSTRIALVVRYVPEKKFYVVSGRNMSEVEMRIRDFTMKLTIGLLLMLAATFGLELFGAYRHSMAVAMGPNPR